MKNTDDEPRRLSFKDFTVVDYVPGEGQYINYQAQKRHRGTVGEEVEQTDEGIVSTGIAKVKAGHYNRKANKSFNKARGALGYSKGKSIAKGTSDEEGFAKHMKKSNDYERKAKKIKSDAFRKTKKFSSYKSNLRDDPPRPPYKSKLRDDPPELWQKESVEHLDEKVRPLEMTQAKYDSYPKNKKGKSGGKLYIIQNQKSGVTKGGVKFTSLGGGAGTTKVPVKIVKELPYKYEESVEQVDEISQGLRNRYLKKANNDLKDRRKKRSDMVGGFGTLPDNPKTPEEKKKWMRDARKRPNRHAGVKRATRMGEDVEQTDEMSNRLLNRYSDAAKKDTKKDRAKGMRKARNIRTQRANKGLFGSDIGEEVEQVDEKVVPYNKELLARMIDLVHDYLVDMSSHGDITEKDYKSAMAVIKKIAGDKVAAEVSSERQSPNFCMVVMAFLALTSCRPQAFVWTQEQ